MLLKSKVEKNKFRFQCNIPKEYHVCEKDYIWNPAAYHCENGIYLVIIIMTQVLSAMQLQKWQKPLQH